jgi:hypothetical protein
MHVSAYVAGYMHLPLDTCLGASGRGFAVGVISG